MYQPLPATSELGARAVTWEQVAALIASRPDGQIVADYLNWRLALLS
jgi:hypothetical protein